MTMADVRILKSLDGGAALTTGEVPDALVLTVPAGVKLTKPVHLTNVLSSEADCDTHLDLYISLAAGSEADVVIADRSAAELPFHTRRRIHIDLAPDATLHLVNMEELCAQAVSESAISISCGGHLSMGTFSLTGGTTTNRVTLDFTAPGASCDLYGMVIASGKQQVTNQVFVAHRQPRCTDRELYKYILDEEATGRFEGLVRVHPGAAGADSQQTSRNICLSRAARMFAQPQLIIDTDDVRCSHGATVGQLDEEALFYMQQRGVSRHEARLLLLSAFLSEVIDRTPVASVRDRLHLLAEARLRGELNHCVSCGVCKQ